MPSTKTAGEVSSQRREAVLRVAAGIAGGTIAAATTLARAPSRLQTSRPSRRSRQKEGGGIESEGAEQSPGQSRNRQSLSQTIKKKATRTKKGPY